MRTKLARYYHLRRAQGQSTIEATLLLPLESMSYFRRRLSDGDQINGYHRYDQPLLVSYSRSGTNWFRFIVESISERPTPGQVRIYYGSDYILDRAHRAYPVLTKYKRAILLLRDYRECLIRHHTDLWYRIGEVERFLRDESVFQKPDWYIKNVAAFDAFQGEKLVVHYEDLLGNPEEAIHATARFMKLSPTRTEHFIENLDQKFADSVSAYRRGGHRSVTSQKRDFRHHANEHLTLDQQRAFDIYFQRHHPALWKKYLQRYAVV